MLKLKFFFQLEVALSSNFFKCNLPFVFEVSPLFVAFPLLAKGEKILCLRILLFVPHILKPCRGYGQATQHVFRVIQYLKPSIPV
jgi:hypothetical protein